MVRICAKFRQNDSPLRLIHSPVQYVMYYSAILSVKEMNKRVLIQYRILS